MSDVAVAAVPMTKPKLAQSVTRLQDAALGVLEKEFPTTHGWQTRSAPAIVALPATLSVATNWPAAQVETAEQTVVLPTEDIWTPRMHTDETYIPAAHTAQVPQALLEPPPAACVPEKQKALKK